MPVKDNILFNEKPFVQPPRIPVHTRLLNSVKEKLEKFGDHDWLIDGVSGEKITYAQIIPATIAISSYLTRHGFKHGDIIMLYCYNNCQFFLPVLAAWACGGGVTFASPGSLPASVANQARESNASLIFADGDTIQKAREVVSLAPCIKKVVIFDDVVDGATCFSDLLSDDGKYAPENTEIDLDNDIVYLPYSSGTTGLPKGIVHTHSTVTAMFYELGMQPGAVFILGSQMFHLTGFLGGLAPLLNFSKNIFLKKYNDDAFLNMLDKYKPFFIFCLPSPLMMMIKRENLEKYDLESIKLIICGGSYLSAESQRALMKKLPGIIDVSCGLGMSELGGVTSFGLDLLMNPAFKALREEHRASLGQPNPGTEIKVIDEDGNNLGPDQLGEICVRNPSTMKGYLNRPEATAKTMMPGGWVMTGDYGYYNEEGFLYWKERKKELLKYKGFHVVPAALETLLLQHPSIDDAAVVGIPDEDVGELVCACVVFGSNCTTKEEEILNYMNSQLSEYEQLRGGVRIFKSLPYNDVGKLSRRDLLKMVTDSMDK